MIPILAQAVESMVPVNAVTLIIGAVASAIALVIGKRQGRQEVVESRTVEIEGQPLAFRHEEPLATVKALDDLRRDVDSRLGRIEEELGEQRATARNANGNLHARIDKVSENLSGVKGSLDEVNKNVRLLLERSLGGRKPTL
jgi:hypothetical protein